MKNGSLYSSPDPQAQDFVQTSPTSQPKRVIICDDHDLVTHLLQTWLTLEASLTVLQTFNRGADAIKAASGLKPDILIQDLQLPDLSGIEVIQRIRATGNQMRIYAITGRADFARAAIEAGANGCMLKDESPEELLRALRSDLQGGVWLSPMLAAHFFNANKAFSNVKLTNAEATILRHLNLSNSEIAEKLVLSEGRVRNVVSAIYQKINVETREDAMRWARDILLISYE
jgi:two-component system response regulator DesR